MPMNTVSTTKPTMETNCKPTTTRANESFTVTWDDSDGTLSSLVMGGDPDRMNWIEGTDRWGAIRLHRMDFEGGTDTWGDTTRMAFAGMREEGNAVISTYRLGAIRAEVRREVTEEGLSESYVFTNEATYPVYFLRGHLGILARRRRSARRNAATPTFGAAARTRGCAP